MGAGTRCGPKGPSVLTMFPGQLAGPESTAVRATQGLYNSRKRAYTDKG